jgi:hypothetical protein
MKGPKFAQPGTSLAESLGYICKISLKLFLKQPSKYAITTPSFIESQNLTQQSH